MSHLNDLTGKTFGSWLVLYRNGSTPNKAAIWRCKCLLCGAERDVAGYSLTSGASTKCRACVPRITESKPHRKERIYHIYTAMKQRCTNPNAKHYSRYGGRGIAVCDEWLSSPDAFIEWALSHGYADNLTIERIDYDKGYCPENCCWIPQKAQSKNRSNSHRIGYKGEVFTLADACKAAGISRETVRSYQYRHGCAMQEAFDHYI